MNKEGEQPAEDVARLPRKQPPTVSMKGGGGEVRGARAARRGGQSAGRSCSQGSPRPEGREKKKKRDANQKQSVLDTRERTWPRKRKK